MARWARDLGQSGRQVPKYLLLALPVLAVTACDQENTGSSVESKELTVTNSVLVEGPKVAGDSEAVQAKAAPAPAPAPEKKTVWVLMKDKAQLAHAASVRDWRVRGATVRGALASTAAQSQASLRARLNQKGIKHRPFFIVNAMKVEADQATIDEIAKRSDVARIVQDRTYSIPPRQSTNLSIRPQAVEWGLASIRAPEVWSTYGFRGDGIVVANIDTGVEFTHPALVRQYRGSQPGGGYDHNYNWFDPAMACGKPSNQPCDNVGHGTHTMGTMVGDDGGENQIGVAPAARWIAAKGCESSSCTTESLLAAAEWILAPTDLSGQNPRDDLRPHIVNNSWGGGNGDPFFQAAVEAWVNAGIFPAFSIGNSGSACGSANSPGDYEPSYAAGAYDEWGNIAWFSSRGPTLDGRIKPNIAAPGVNVRSSVPGSSYDYYSGTSMASPHLSGAVALLWSGASSLVGDIVATREILDSSAVDVSDLSCGGEIGRKNTARQGTLDAGMPVDVRPPIDVGTGDPGKNNVWGEGRLDVFAAMELAPIGPSGFLSGTVRSAADGQPLVGATLLVQGGTRDRVVRTAPDGTYQTRLGVGSYTVTAKAFGFLDTVASVTITDGVTTVQDFDLAMAPSFALSGTVRTAGGSPVAGAVVSILQTPLAPATTDASGRYSFAAVPQGQYEVRATGSACYDNQITPVTLAANTSLDFALPQRVDSYGYSCLPAAYSYIAANTVLPIGLNVDVADITLPFPFTLYGQSYETATVTAYGYVSFVKSTYASSGNSTIPDATPPNAAIYPFWDELFAGYGSSVRTELVGTAPHRRLVIEWRDMFSGYTGSRTSFEVVLFEDSRILMQYPSGDDPWQQGLTATVGIENEAGNTAFQYSYNSASLPIQSAVLYSLPASGIVQGTIRDANDSTPVAGATVEAKDRSGNVVRSATSLGSGFYRLLLPAGTYTVVATKRSYAVAQATASVVVGQTYEVNLSLKTGRATLSPTSLQLLVPIGQKRTRSLVLGNTGSSALTYQLAESGGRKLAVAPTRTLKRLQGFNSNALSTKGLFSGLAGTPSIGTDAAGDVLASFVPAGMQLAWGVGVTDKLWLGDAMARLNAEFVTDGTPTGRKWPTPWAGQWPADMASDTTHNLICQLDVGGDNGIHCWNSDTGNEVDRIVGSFPWTQVSQRGLAYRPDDDSFYVGGWNEGVIYHVKGLGASDKGAVISSCAPADGAISGLAYNPAAGLLWVSTNSSTDTIYGLNPEDCTVLSTLAHPAPGWAGAGLDMDQEGNLWMADQQRRMAILMDSGVPAFSDVPWLTPTPVSGTILPGKSANIAVEVNTNGMAAGIYLATLYVQTSAAKQTMLRVPVSLVVTAYQQGVVAGGNAYTDSLGDPWAADRAYSTGAWGYAQKSKTASTSKTIGGTTDQPLFKTQRINPYAYRFDNVPNGVYQVDLNFAEIAGAKMGKRLYDVIIEDTVVLPAHDIVYEVGALKADKHMFFVEVTHGQMDIRLIPRAKSDPPVVSSLRVTHRPDR